MEAALQQKVLQKGAEVQQIRAALQQKLREKDAEVQQIKATLQQKTGQDNSATDPLSFSQFHPNEKDLQQDRKSARSPRKRIDTTQVSMGLPVDVNLKSKPHLAILYGELLSVASQWQDIGTLLGLDPDEFSTIKFDEGNTRSCLRVMLTLWLKQSSPLPTKSKIITVLRKLGLDEKAQRLEKELT